MTDRTDGSDPSGASPADAPGEESIDLSEEEWYGHVWGGIEFRF